MKALRVVGNVIIGLILFALIFSLIFIRETNKIISSDVLKEALTNVANDVKGNKDLSESRKEYIDNIFKDEKSKEIVNLILRNYSNYRNDDNFSISDEDYKTFYNFILEHKDEIKDNDIRYMSETEFENYYNINKVNNMAKDTFQGFDRLFDSRVINNIIKSYSFATSYYVRLAIIFVIIFFIILLCLMNWSLIKWMLVFGFSLIASGFFFNLLYYAASIIKEFLLNDNFNINIDLSSFLLAGIVQVVLGIILIVVYIIFKGKYGDIIKKDTTQL